MQENSLFCYKGEKMRKIETTLVYLKDGDKILLSLKKRGFAEGKLNGVGGKLKEGETIENTVIRETKEEIDVDLIEYEKVGLIDFIEIYKGEKENVVMHVYIASKWEGEPKESDEVKPVWVDISNMPYDQMMPDDKYWLPQVLEGKKINAKFEFDENWKLINKLVEEL